MRYIRLTLLPQAGAASHYVSYGFKIDPKVTGASLSQHLSRKAPIADPRLEIAVKVPSDPVAGAWIDDFVSLKGADIQPCATRWSHKSYLLLEPTMAPNVYVFYGVFRTIKEAKKHQQERWLLASLITRKHKPVYFINNEPNQAEDVWQI